MMRQNAFRSGPRRGRAFTLIELLVSMTVLSVIVLLIAQLFSSATNVTVGSRKRLDADSQARLVFDHLALDFSKMLKRNDVDYLFAKIDGKDATHGENDKMFFYSEAPAYLDNTSAAPSTRSTVALVGYRINPAYQLERLGKQLTWDGTPVPAASPANSGGIMFLSPGATVNPDPASTLAVNWASTIGTSADSPIAYTPATYDQDYQVLAEQVCRLEICFQLKDGSYSPIPVCPVTNQTPNPKNKLDATTGPTVSADTAAGYTVGSRWYDNTGSRGFVCANNALGAAVWNVLGMQDVRAIVVAMAILDGTSSKSVRTVAATIDGRTFQAPKLDLLAGVLADAHPSDVTTPGSASSVLTIPSFSTPPPVGTPVPSRLMAEAWSNETKQASFAQDSGLPAPAAAQVRVYQRSFVLNNQ